MTTQPPLVIPRLIPPRTAGNPTPARVVAAVRWDYEYGLLSMAQCIERYGTLLHPNTVRDICAGRIHPNTVRDICAGRIHPDVKASRLKLLWR